jgi:hydrogenase maturation protease
MNVGGDRMLVVGIGNELLGDEGLGVHVVRSLRDDRGSLPTEVDLLEAGTALLDALQEMSAYPRVILVDAVRAGRESGTLYRWELVSDSIRRCEYLPPTSMHDWGLIDTLRAAEMLGLLPKRITLLGAEPAFLGPGMELSPEVARAKERLIAIVREIGTRNV